jgi:uncharacterized protein YbjT (DUF2867 family)
MLQGRSGMMRGRVFVTGGTGFVGTVVVEELLDRGFGINLLMRSEKPTRADARIQHIQGDLFDESSLNYGMQGCGAAIHLVGIIQEKPSKGVTFERIHFEGTRRVVEAARRNNVRRYIHMSALRTRENAVSEYHKTKYRAEQLVRDSGLDWTIIRPSMIHGPGGEFMRMETNWARRKAPPFFFMPYFGAGLFGGRASLLQPVYVKDVARAFVDAIDRPQTIHQTYELAGPDAMSWPQFHRTVSQAIVGKRRLTLPIPAWKAKLLTRILPGFLLPFNRDQVIMSQEDNTADLTKFARDFGWTPQPFVATLNIYASQMR